MADPVFVGVPRRLLQVRIDGQDVQVMEGMTILDACRQQRIDTPTLCALETLTPVNVCRVCVVEVEGSRVLVLLASSVDMSLCSPEVGGWMDRYGAQPQRFGPAAATVAQPVKVDNELYVRDYSRCILCYQCVEACGVDAQNTFA